MDHTLAWFWYPLGMLLLLYLPRRGAYGFFPNFWSRTMAFTWGSITHQDMTEEAILNITLRLFVETPHPTTGKHIREEDFKDRTLLADDIFAAYYGPDVSAKRFRGAVAQVANANAAMDFINTTRDDPVLHFDSELIRSTNAWLLQTRKELLQAVSSEQYVIARDKLGQLFHTLQDFYSHSNWVELGHRQPHPHLLQPGREIKAIAEAGIRTCSDCSDWTCQGNLLEGLLAKGLLTTGYYGTQPEKPTGKCSHGGRFDESRHREPRGGINKDSSSLFFSPHHYLHSEAAALAREASIHFLEELWREIGSKQFMRLLDISPATGLSFVVDTTGSMGEEISAAKRQAWEIITSRRATLQEPDFYLLVPFHDPEFGPVSKTSDPDEFLKILDTISPLAGGDEPEMCLSALQLALQTSPPYSEIFVFTDASAKDAHLKNSVEALIQEQKCKVTFLITEDPSRTRVKRETLSPDRFNLYVNLAHSSGGQIIFTDNENIKRVSEIIGESSISSVTLFRHQKGNIFSLERSQRRTKKQTTEMEVHRFWIDSLVDKVILTIQGGIQTFQIWNPAGTNQASSSTSGPLAKIQSIGGIYRAFLFSPVLAGEWTLKLLSKGHYSVHVQGQSTFDFLYYFAVPEDGRHPGLFIMDSHPIEGLPTYLVVMAMGLNRSELGSVQLQAVNLEGRGGSLGELKLQGGANQADLFVAELPPTLQTNSSFSVVLHGVDSEGQKVERAAPQATTVEGSLLELSTDTPVFPGRPVTIGWKVTNPGSSKQYDLKVSSVPRFLVNISSSRLHLGFNQTATGQIALNVLDAADPGSVITVTLQANLLHAVGDPSFAHIQLLVMPLPPVQKLSSPVCNVTSVGGSCGPPQSPCRSQRWMATLRIWDKAGVRSVQVEGGAVVPHHADGLAESVTYASNCCSQQARLVVTNLLGEKYWCQVASAPPAPPDKATASPPDVLRKPVVAAAAATTSWWWVLTAFMEIGWLRL
ncbi:von Willebrand factor A domain-containing protein 7 isoform X2 [Rhineura floridana]|nr:von Willebrand factor A domain-containing protein 7 isoform X2 [Rhineura floridana]XP_061475253.1 von Willebrand factor A domain-containing protein 7 isoform X2 [Rhineura floridana]XP_061475254.1 von Willebrand factor A domain-containing protein 7 isoform X2 [Rhineura floridana]XP_061475255.1 von Willebrand factor A domain-containing protein 7 isoform X2 [Rhineura floridana]XP_061475256.1 von Willebrand factor A domain-containing protein 7 isoform X2 [Rhineura floridana]